MGFIHAMIISIYFVIKYTLHKSISTSTLYDLPFGPTMHMREVMSMPKFSPWNSQGRPGPYLKFTSRTYTMHTYTHV